MDRCISAFSIETKLLNSVIIFRLFSSWRSLQQSTAGGSLTNIYEARLIRHVGLDAVYAGRFVVRKIAPIKNFVRRHKNVANSRPI